MEVFPVDSSPLGRPRPYFKLAVAYRTDRETFLAAVQEALPRFQTQWVYDGHNSTTLFLRSTDSAVLLGDLELDLALAADRSTVAVHTRQAWLSDFFSQLTNALDQRLERV